LIISTAERTPKIPAPVAAPFTILISKDGFLPAISSKEIILSNRSKSDLSSINK
jgi:hypothetical protein